MSGLRLDYGPQVEGAIALLEAEIVRNGAVAERYPTRWLAVALLDEDPGLAAEVGSIPGGVGVVAEASRQLGLLRLSLGASADTAIAGSRFDWVHNVVGDVSGGDRYQRPTMTDRIDSVVTNRFLGIPLFLLAMWTVFKLTTDVAAVFLNWIDGALSGPITRLVAGLFAAVGLGGTWVESLVTEGILSGVGAVLVFIPVLFTLYLALAFLEDTGYMARAAFVMDRAMRGIGLQGKSFLPMLVGFGCTVPAIYATRTLESDRDRTLTALLVPFMSCGARLPVYVLMATIFFPNHAGLVVFSMYLLGIVVAMAVGAILRRSVLRGGEAAPTIMELPPYRLPTVRSIWFHTWGRTRAFLRGAGTIILVTSVVVWLAMAIPVGGTGTFADADVDDSAFAAAAGAVAPALAPLGFGSWEASGSLMSGFVAKEVIISTMAQVYGVEEDTASESAKPVLEDVSEIVVGFGRATVDTVKAVPAIVGIDLRESDEEEVQGDLAIAIEAGFEESSGGHGALAALAFMVFVLLYTPCMAAIAAQRHELGTRWMWGSVLGQTALAWVMAFVVFQGGLLLGVG
ncbi:MAG: ferrous iron transport protein B [Actinomycetota bacterium]|nr:ferrous iron transport protein B [Actinomycetota bacterium]